MRRRVARILLLSLVFSMGLVVAGRVPGAWACSCVGNQNTADYFSNADMVFAGKAVSMNDPKAGQNLQSSADRIEYTFDVESVQQGHPSDLQTVTSARSGASCGISFEIGKRYQVFTYDRDHVGLCSGTHVLAAGEHPLAKPLPRTGLSHTAAGFAAGMLLVVAGAFLRTTATRRA